MSFGSSFDSKEQVRQATDLVDVVSRSIRLRRQGRNYVGLCPWHDDSRPSLQVNPEKQLWKCWVCDVGGDVFSFVMKRENVDFAEALRILADRAGIQLTGPRPTRTRPGSPEDKPTLYQALEWAEQQFHQFLLRAPDAEPARQYLLKRGIQQESIERFRLGYSPNRWQWLLDRAKSTPFSPEVLDAAGLVSRTQDGRRWYDRFRGRLIFSIRDTEHRCIAFGGRILPGAEGAADAPKYVNSPETRLFSKSNNLYALEFVRETVVAAGEIVVVEGYTDVIMAHQCGVTNVVAALGTALGQRHVKLLQRFADRITLVLDGDEAGQRRTNEILDLFIAANADLRVLTLPAGLDPCDYLQREGATAFRALLSAAVDALEHKVNVATAGVDVLQDSNTAHKALEEILKTLARSRREPAEAAESMRLRQQHLLARLARRFHVEEATLRDRLRELRQSNRPTDPHGAPARPHGGLQAPEVELFEIMIAHHDLVGRALASIRHDDLASPLGRQLWELYRQAERDGVGHDPAQIMLLAESPELKTELVRLEESAAEKSKSATEPPPQRLDGMIRHFEIQRERSDQRKTLATLEQRGYDEKEEIAVLQRIIEQERNRQGISAPTDG